MIGLGCIFVTVFSATLAVPPLSVTSWDWAILTYQQTLKECPGKELPDCSLLMQRAYQDVINIAPDNPYLQGQKYILNVWEKIFIKLQKSIQSSGQQQKVLQNMWETALNAIPKEDPVQSCAAQDVLALILIQKDVQEQFLLENAKALQDLFKKPKPLGKTKEPSLEVLIRENLWEKSTEQEALQKIILAMQNLEPTNSNYSLACTAIFQKLFFNICQNTKGYTDVSSYLQAWYLDADLSSMIAVWLHVLSLSHDQTQTWLEGLCRNRTQKDLNDYFAVLNFHHSESMTTENFWQSYSKILKSA